MGNNQNVYLENLREMRDRVKKDFSEEYGSDEEIFVQEFLNGHYHEEEADWRGIAKGLSKEQLSENALAVIHVPIAGRGANRDGNELQVIMRFYKAFRAWVLGTLKSTDDILLPLNEMKELVVASAHTEACGWWADTVRLFSLIHLGVICRMGLSWIEVSQGYDAVVHDLCNPK